MIAILEHLGVIGAWGIHRFPLISLELGVFALLIMMLLRLRILQPARIQKWFWLVVLAKPIVMLIIISPLALNVGILQDVPFSQVTLDPGLSQPNVSDAGELPVPAQTSVPTTDMAFQHPSFWSLVRGSLDWSHALAILWISAFTFLCERALMGFRKLSKLRGQAVPLDRLHDVLASLGSSLGIRWLPEIRVSREVSSPLLFGLFHPVILLPSGLCERLSPEALRLILLHELFHWKHRDTWMLLFKRLVEAFFFFHPAVWYAGRMVIRASEQACDDAVVSFTGNSAGYASCLLSISESAGSQRRYALAGLAVKDSAVGQRIKRILKEGLPMISKRAILVSLSVLVLVSVLGLPTLLTSKGGDEVSVSSLSIAGGTGLVRIAGARPASNEGWIVFKRDGYIWVMDADGKNEKKLTTSGNDWAPAWSPDGKQIAFTRWEEPDPGIYIMNADGSNMKRLTNGLYDYWPAWSPDGKQIAFTREVWEQEDGKLNVKSGAIYVMDPDGTNLRKLIEKKGLAFYRDPDWSPDGRKIVFYYSRLGAAPQQVWVMDADGSNQRMIYDWGKDPAWSPDGKRIAFTSMRAGWNTQKPWDIYVMDADGSNVQVLTDPGLSSDFHPAWSPDGTEIVFGSDRDGNYEIYVMDADGSNVRRLTNTPANEELDPDWTASSYAVKPAGKLKATWGKIKRGLFSR